MVRRSWFSLMLSLILLAMPSGVPGAVMAAAAVLPPPPPEQTAAHPDVPGPESRVALAELNRVRVALELPPLAYSRVMAEAAQNHARYLAAHPELACCDAHGEQRGTWGFTGADVLERVQAVGFAGFGAAEVIAHGQSAEEAVWDWLATPYHRLPLIAAYTESAAFAARASGAESNQVMALAVTRTQARQPVVFPPDGMTGVPVEWSGLETPDPLRFAPGASGPLGFTAGLVFPAPVVKFVLTRATLAGPQGEVPVYRLTPDRDEHLKQGVALLPRTPLEPQTTYTVAITGEADWGMGPQPFDHNWSFTTRPEVPRARRASFAGRGGVVEEIELTGGGFSSGTRAYIAGITVPVEVQAPTRVRLPVPAGLPAGPADLLLAGPGGETVWPQFFTGSERLPAGADGLSEWSLFTGGTPVAVPALLEAGGADADRVLIPSDALVALGAVLERDPGTGRRLIRLGENWVVAGPPRGAAWAGKESTPHLGWRVDLPRPPLERSGRVYFPGAMLKYLGVTVLLDKPAGTVTAVAAGTLFPDTLRHWARPAVLALSRLGVVGGYPDGSFRPDQPLTRAALIRMAVAARDLTPGVDAGPVLPGTAGHWVATQGWLQAAVAGGLVVPEPPPVRLQPDQVVTRLELLVMAVRALGLEQEAHARAGDPLTGFTDAGKVASRDRGYVQLALAKGLISGYPEADGRLSLRPDQPANRAEATAIMLRMRTALGR